VVYQGLPSVCGYLFLVVTILDIACERKQFYSQILEAEGSNSFYKLIRRGLSNTVNKPKGFRSEGRIIVDLVDQCKGFSNFYEDLAVPKQLVEFNSDYQKDVSQHIDLIREIINNIDSDHAMSCRCCDRMSLLMVRRSSTIG
jgi:hypothetical protein